MQEVNIPVLWVLCFLLSLFFGTSYYRKQKILPLFFSLAVGFTYSRVFFDNTTSLGAAAILALMCIVAYSCGYFFKNVVTAGLSDRNY